MDIILQEDLIKTGFLHTPLPLHAEKSVELRLKAKPILQARTLWNAGGPCNPVHSNKGWMKVLQNEDGDQVVRMNAPVVADHWPEGATPDGDYSNYGSLCFHLPIQAENWENFNRISFKVKPECPGNRVVHLSVCITNDGVIKVPDEYFREGGHVINLKNHEWNSCIWEFNEMARDKVIDVMFYAFLCGKDTSTGDYLEYDFKEIELQKVENPEIERGWICAKETVSFSTTGYWTNGNKTAIANTDAFEFSIVNQDGKEEFHGIIKKIENARGTFKLLDFSSLTKQGEYQIKFGNTLSESFEIGDNVMDNAVWKVTNFLYCERCGYPVPTIHGMCHMDLIAEHNGLKLPFCGGWHDAGDLSQQMAQSAEIAQALFEMGNQVKDDILLYNRLMEEAQWGLEFVLRCRIGDGYRATSAGVTRWTDGKIGNMDDVAVRSHNHAFENFLCAGIEAFAAQSLLKVDPELAWKCIEVAKEDFHFAIERFEKVGMELPLMHEHTYNSGLSTYYANIVWSASNVYAVTKDPYFAQQAREFAEKLLSCQEAGESNLPIKGFFYRDSSKKTIVHFNHQSREQLFMQALALLCTTQNDHPDKIIWEKSMAMYGDYLKYLMQFAAPYGMVPAGIYKYDEPEDAEVFALLHPSVTHDQEKNNYKEQLKQAVRIDDNFCIRCFPVWFSFRGNSAVHLAMGKAASILGKYFHDKELIEIAREQLYWIAGKNPFGQSIMYGEGSNYAQQYTVSSGEMVGELPVGIESYGNEDAPYYPQNNNCTYKEVWTTPAGRWLWVAADLYHGEL